MCVPIAGAIMQGFGATMGVMRERQRADQQSALYRREEALTRSKGAFEGARKREEVDRVVSQQRAGFSANGLDINTGSAADVINDTQTEGNLDTQAIIWNTEEAAKTSKYKADAEKASKPSGLAVGLSFVSPIIKTVGDSGKQAFGF